jgi:hypothetical protein
MFDLSLRDLTEITGGTLRLASLPPLGGADEPVRRIVTDSRHVGPGDVFWALPGRYHDGAQYAEHALMQSALAVVVHGRQVPPWAGSGVIRVDDAGAALERLARWIRYHYVGKVILLQQQPQCLEMTDCLHEALAGTQQGTLGRNLSRPLPDVARAMLQWNEHDEYALLELAAAADPQINQILDLCDPDVIAIKGPQLIWSASDKRPRIISPWGQDRDTTGTGRNPVIVDLAATAPAGDSPDRSGHRLATAAAMTIAAQLGADPQETLQRLETAGWYRADAERAAA